MFLPTRRHLPFLSPALPTSNSTWKARSWRPSTSSGETVLSTSFPAFSIRGRTIISTNLTGKIGKTGYPSGARLKIMDFSV